MITRLPLLSLTINGVGVGRRASRIAPRIARTPPGSHGTHRYTSYPIPSDIVRPDTLRIHTGRSSPCSWRAPPACVGCRCRYNPTPGG
eukprot:5686210-Pyramimonas_sp.AAC.1